MPNSAQIASLKDIPKGKAASVEEVLLRDGLISQKQIDFVRNEVKRRQEPAEKIISSMGWVQEEELARAKSEVLGILYSQPDKKPISPEVLNYIPEEVAKRFSVIPIGRDKDTLEVAMVDPLDLQVFEFIEKKSGMVIRPYLATQTAIARAISDQYTKGLSSEVTEA